MAESPLIAILLVASLVKFKHGGMLSPIFDTYLWLPTGMSRGYYIIRESDCLDNGRHKCTCTLLGPH